MNTGVPADDRWAQLAAELRDALVDRLVADGAVTPGWEAAFRAVPRHVFVDTSVERTREGLELVYSDTALITQQDGGVASSSSSQPSLMGAMLDNLAVADGDRVLEIGTGTGYNAALLCHRLGDHRVSSVDIDAELVSTARSRLEGVGHRPVLAVADGAAGLPAHAPYDRILATYAVSRIPAPWLAQTRCGSIIVAPMGYGTARLDVHGDGSASGRFVGPSAFMPLRSHSGPPAMTVATMLAATSDTTTGTVGHLPTMIDRPATTFLLSLLLPDVRCATIGPVGSDPPHLDRIWMDAVDGSWVRARRTLDGSDDVSISEVGRGDLWQEIEQVASAVEQLGCPGIEAFRLRITRTGDQFLSVTDTGWSVRLS